MVEFEQGGFFHLPIRCTTIAQSGDLCDSCRAKEKKTQERVREITGTTIGGMLPSYLMGRVSEPIPFWSRLYGGAWYNLKVESGCTLSEETMAKVKKALLAAYDGVAAVEPEPMPGKRKMKPVAAAPEAPAAQVAAVAVAPPPKKKYPKKAVAAVAPVACELTGIIQNPTEELPVEAIRHINVRKVDVEGVEMYLGPKDKLYDKKFKWRGRLVDGKCVINGPPDSDEGM